ncbi:hypothetical protein [Alteraurantiacibacter buctensis]|uniref:PRC-barrel domain-containing protein n=1 Tax=Alteraurantiacibacter buctensis TaxID=1503981 RepID=A0A844YYK4_9SPHN|nr:hypothetical protein [Alteraurantiacibacter buctensis]MXO72629.1 hypothetical protein [Alteraurantiacibacter buctensis]
MNFKIAFAAAAILAAAQTAQAQDVGATVNGNDGAAVGTVLSNDGSTVVVDTGTHQVPLPADVFAAADGGSTLNTTKAELDQLYGEQLAQAAAARDAKLVVGAAVVTADAQPLGTIDQVDGDNIVIREGEFVVTLPRDLLALDTGGNVMVRATKEAIMAAVAAG